MSETLVQNRVCSKCGEEARPQAQFCFACGGEIIGGEGTSEDKVSSAWFKGDLIGTDEAAESEAIVESEKADAEVERVESALHDDSVTEKSEAKTADSEKSAQKTDPANGEAPERSTGRKEKLKSAAEIRRRPKPVRSRQVEIVWSERKDSPNMLFLVFGLVFVAISGLLLFLALYLK